MFLKYNCKRQKLTSRSSGLLELNFLFYKSDYKEIVNLVKSWYNIKRNVNWSKIKRYKTYILY